MAGDIKITKNFKKHVQDLQTAKDEYETGINQVKAELLKSFEDEAKSFTRSGSVAPLYLNAHTAFKEFLDRYFATANAAVTTAEGSIATLTAKYAIFMETDSKNAADMLKLA